MASNFLEFSLLPNSICGDLPTSDSYWVPHSSPCWTCWTEQVTSGCIIVWLTRHTASYTSCQMTPTPAASQTEVLQNTSASTLLFHNKSKSANTSQSVLLLEGDRSPDEPGSLHSAPNSPSRQPWWSASTKH